MEISIQTPKRYDDITVKLPITIMFGNEDDWHEDEKNRMIGDVDAFGKTSEDQDNAEEIKLADEDVVIDIDTEEIKELGDVEGDSNPNIVSEDIDNTYGKDDAEKEENENQTENDDDIGMEDDIADDMEQSNYFNV